MAVAAVLSTTAWISGCTKSRAEVAEVTLPETEVVLVRTGPLTGEHPLYPDYRELGAQQMHHAASARIQALEAFMTSPLGRSLARPAQPVFRRPEVLTLWEERANIRLATRIEQADGLLEQWPHPGDVKAMRRVEQAGTAELREAQNEASLARMRAETEAVRRRAGELAELRLMADSDDTDEAAYAADRQAQVWREIEAEVAEVVRESADELAQLRSDYEERLVKAKVDHTEDDEAEQTARAEALLESGSAARERQGAGLDAAAATVEPGENLTDTPPPPDTGDVSELISQAEAAQQAAQARRQVRLQDARARLLEEIGKGTNRAVRAVAAMNGIEVRFVATADEEIPDATEQFRSLLRDYWAARRPVRESDG